MESIENLSTNGIWSIINQQLQENKNPYEDVNAVYEFQLTDEESGIYQLEFKNGDAFVYYTNEKNPDCTLKMKLNHFKKFLLGNLNSTTAFMTGKLKIDGNISLALKLENMLKQYEFSK
ncbi:SCP2 sterol-binding domain-containing protein [Virgibacillus doumboii]|uniref:SCP2 sterol-binding domain-containing protein n=1 Tax=Virgibacillus doumboii TaxID=2697503 RepID=UPI0013DFB208|nr:SCP2 sterol-binding domain-containing protein [Virgibacillus doumboii]